jgi:hypothetical protein
VTYPKGYPAERTYRQRGVRGRIPRPAKAAAVSVLQRYGRATSGVRLVPAYVILGAQRCGTTSLHKLLTRHPGIGAPVLKEVRYFDLHFAEGEAWYRSHFPTRMTARMLAHRAGGRYITGEASPDYLPHPHAAERLSRLLPDARLVIMLRDPVERAYSHFQHETALGFETLDFAGALDAEADRLRGEYERMEREPGYHSHAFQHHSYMRRGMYADQLKRWFALFPSEQMLVIRSEDFYTDEAAVYRNVLGFLGMAAHQPDVGDRRNALRYGAMAPDARERLRATFAGPNTELEDMLGRRMGWRE